MLLNCLTSLYRIESMDLESMFNDIAGKLRLSKTAFHLSHQVPLPAASIRTFPEKPKESHVLRNTLLGLGGAAALGGAGYLADQHFNSGNVAKTLGTFVQNKIPALRTNDYRKAQLNNAIGTGAANAHDNVFESDARVPHPIENVLNNFSNASSVPLAAYNIGSPIINKFTKQYPALNSLNKSMAGVSGATSGWDLTGSPSVVDAWTDIANNILPKHNPNVGTPDWYGTHNITPEVSHNTVRNTLGAVLSPMLGTAAYKRPSTLLPTAVAQMGLGSFENTVRNNAGMDQQMSNLGDLLANYGQGAKHGDPESLRQLKVLTDISQKAFQPEPRVGRLWNWLSNIDTDRADRYPVTKGLLDRATKMIQTK
jgi:hypothetical protein